MTGDSESFGVYVGMRQSSVLNPLLFAIVMDAVTWEARAGLPWDVLYADDLVLMTPSKEELRMKREECRRCLVGKGMKVNAGMSKAVVNSDAS